MRSKGIIILGVLWIVLSLLCFWAENTVLAIVMLCAGIIELAIGLIKRNKEKEIQ